ncbi:MAG: transglycosylase domain-containing protein, partial [Deltaproteobacteria bacterium]|nr:transglycosylase domain-containing protein [Deltaproteobacteria bacterium]
MRWNRRWWQEQSPWRHRALGTGACLSLVALAAAGARLAARPVLSGVSFSQELVDRQGRLLRLTLSADDKYRLRTRLDDIDPRYVEAVLLLEDRHFFAHPGVNPVALVRAAASLVGGGARVGASTLTMQLARVRYGLQTRTLGGKVRQIAAALWLELTHSKRELLEAYVNLVPFGANVEGIGAASRIYFGRAARKLALGELLSLAVIPQSPAARRLSEGGLVTGVSLVRARERLATRWIERHPGDAKHVGGGLKLPLAAQR